ncbi:MAG: pilus (MSHA type) biogenesis protein MshL [Rhodocyclaceae bacterium]|nr:pilus (MSHA type) biogenesis protein MshL [Rhodocyclaceae bacterium]
MINAIVNFPGRRPVMKRQILIPILTLALSACSNAPIQPPGDNHLRTEKVGAGETATIPPPVRQTLALPKPKASPKVETYSVVVNNVRVQELLFALARDAKLNVDIHPGIEGLVTLNAIDQTLQQLLTRITKQADIRWELDGSNLSVMPDKPFLRTYKIDFVNMARNVKSSISTATQIASAPTGGAASAGGAGGNSATTLVTSDTKNDLMESLISNVTDMLKEEDRLRWRAIVETEMDIHAKTEGTGQISASSGSKTERPSGTIETAGPGVSGSGNQKADSRAEAKKKIGEYEPSVSVFANRETGVLIVRATSRQHEKIQQFIDQVMSTAKRQVLIEATIVEVNLNNNYKQGINWSALRSGAKGFQFTQAGTAGLPSANPLNIFTIAYDNPTSRLGNLAAEINLLESFGNVKVLSSPKLSVMNNQTATLKVADNKVYFTVKADTILSGTSGIVTTNFTTTPQSVSVGFIMNVTPQISDGDEVTINVRPTITRITGYVNDPNPSLAAAGVVNRVPEIQTREMESIIKVSSGQIAVMGGLMQEEINNLTDAIPAASNIPFLGNLFKNSNDKSNKTELVIFLRPIVIKDASIQGDYSEYRTHMPGKDFFEKGNVGPQRQQFDFRSGNQ